VRISTGQLIEVDGSSGVVHVIAAPNASAEVASASA
jgi:hypothetical protein